MSRLFSFEYLSLYSEKSFMEQQRARILKYFLLVCHSACSAYHRIQHACY
jgi:hypothetical protein